MKKTLLNKNKIALCVALFIALFAIANVCVWKTAHADLQSPIVNGGQIYEGRDIGGDVRSFDYFDGQLDKIVLDASCTYKDHCNVPSTSNDYTSYGNCIIGKNNPGEYWFGDFNLSDYSLWDLRIDLDAEPNGYGYLNKPKINFLYRTDTDNSDWDGEDFKFYAMFKYRKSVDSCLWAFDMTKVGDFTDLSDSGGDRDFTSGIDLPDELVNKILDRTGSDNLAHAVRDGLLEIQLTKMTLDPH